MRRHLLVGRIRFTLQADGTVELAVDRGNRVRGAE
jgi:hypothetical protein